MTIVDTVIKELAQNRHAFGRPEPLIADNFHMQEALTYLEGGILGPIPDGYILSNISGATAAPIGNGLESTIVYALGLNLYSDTVGGLYVGKTAGQAIVSAGGATAPFNTMVGNFAGQYSAVTTNESTFIGSLAGQYCTGSYSTSVGTHAIGYDPLAAFTTAIGNDAMRNFVNSSTGGSTSVGKSAAHLGSAYNITAIGSLTMFGNSGGIMLSGNPTANETVSVTFTVAAGALYAGAMTGQTHTVNYGVGAAPTLANIATGLAAAINADPTLAPLNNGASLCSVLDTVNIGLVTIGSSINGQEITLTTSTTGTTVLTPNTGYQGHDNAAIGAGAMSARYATTPTYNFAVHLNSLYFITSGSHNTAIGFDAGYNINTGSSNILIGDTAGLSLTSGSDNIALGGAALSNQTAGNGSIGIGKQALSNSTLAINIAIGSQSMVGAAGGTATGGSNTALGVQTATGFTTANFSVFIGYQTGQAVLTGGGQTIVGALAANVMTGGDKNTIYGYSAAVKATTAFNNVIVGYNAGSIITNGPANTIIGYNVASTTLQTGANNVLIGTNSSVDTAAGSTSNTIGIGAGSTAIFYATGCGTPATAIAGVSGAWKTNGYTVAALPAGSDGMRAFVTDASAPAFLTAVVGGGAVHTPVFYSGSAGAWVAG